MHGPFVCFLKRGKKNKTKKKIQKAAKLQPQILELLSKNQKKPFLMPLLPPHCSVKVTVKVKLSLCFN
jgi:hypothetical protein